jgi:hypothetical protein
MVGVAGELVSTGGEVSFGETASSAGGVGSTGGAASSAGGVGSAGGAASSAGGVGSAGGAASSAGGVGSAGGAASSAGGVGSAGGAASSAGGVGSAGGAASSAGGVGSAGGVVLTGEVDSTGGVVGGLASTGAGSIASASVGGDPTSRRTGLTRFTACGVAFASAGFRARRWAPLRVALLVAHAVRALCLARTLALCAHSAGRTDDEVAGLVRRMEARWIPDTDKPAESRDEAVLAE